MNISDAHDVLDIIEKDRRKRVKEGIKSDMPTTTVSYLCQFEGKEEEMTEEEKINIATQFEKMLWK